MTTEGATDRVLAQGKWSFDSEVTDAFDDMLARSVPAYNTMRDLTDALARRFIRPGTDVVDLGCSRGEAMRRLVASNGTLGVRTFVGVEVSEPMLDAARLSFRSEIASGSVRIESLDLRDHYPVAFASVTLAVLTLQFVPVEYRARVLRNAWRSTVEGGALILVEKVLSDDERVHETFDAEYLAMKVRNAYTPEQIAAKKKSLEGVLVSATPSGNEAMLRAAGFRTVECFWRWLNFAGWVALK